MKIKSYENKRGVAPFVIIVFVILGLLIVYLTLHIPIPSFAKIKSLLNYIMILIVWVVFQVGLVYGYYRLGRLAKKGFKIYKGKLQIWTIKVKNFLLTKS